MVQYKQNTTSIGQAQDMYDGGNRDTSQPITFGYPKIDLENRDFRIACRWQPSLNLQNRGIIINSAYIRLTAAGEGAGAFTSGVYVHDGDAPDLNANNLAFGYTDIGNSQNWSIATNWPINVEQTSPDIKLAVQDWFDRSGYVFDDWIGLIVDGGDSASDEYKDCYNGDYVTANYRPELEINYVFVFIDDIAPVVYADIVSVNGVSRDNIEFIL